MPKVLIIAYYFPPAGGAGVQRTLKFVKYLPEFGWEPVILTVNHKEARLLDPYLETEIPMSIPVFRTPAWLLPSRLPWRVRSFVARWLFIVDEQVGWLPFAIAQGRKILWEDTFQALYTTSVPYSDHLIGYRIKKEFRLPWVADFRDAWIGDFSTTFPTRWHKNFACRLEQSIVTTAERVTVVSEPIRQGLLRRHPDLTADKVLVLPNGYDPADFQGLESLKPDANQAFTITYSGSFYIKNRTPDSFLRAVKLAIDKGGIPRHKIHIRFVGNIGWKVRVMIETLGMDDVVETTGYVDHRRSINYLMRSDLLLLIVGTGPGSEGVMTGKIFEYLASQKPILALAPDGVAADLIRETQAGIVVDSNDVEGIARCLTETYYKWENANLTTNSNIRLIQRYDRHKLTQKLASIFAELLNDLPN